MGGFFLQLVSDINMCINVQEKSSKSLSKVVFFVFFFGWLHKVFGSTTQPGMFFFVLCSDSLPPLSQLPTSPEWSSCMCGTWHRYARISASCRRRKRWERGRIEIIQPLWAQNTSQWIYYHISTDYEFIYIYFYNSTIL